MELSGKSGVVGGAIQRSPVELSGAVQWSPCSCRVEPSAVVGGSRPVEPSGVFGEPSSGGPVELAGAGGAIQRRPVELTGRAAELAGSRPVELAGEPSSGRPSGPAEHSSG